MSLAADRSGREFSGVFQTAAAQKAGRTDGWRHWWREDVGAVAAAARRVHGQHFGQLSQRSSAQVDVESREIKTRLLLLLLLLAQESVDALVGQNVLEGVWVVGHSVHSHWWRRRGRTLRIESRRAELVEALARWTGWHPRGRRSQVVCSGCLNSQKVRSIRVQFHRIG